MRFVAPALVAFTVLILAHLALWRIRRPKGQYTTLVLLAAAVLALLFAASRLAVASLDSPPGWLPRSALDHVTAIALYAALFVCYATTYSAVQADSPTMTIVLMIERAGTRGCTRADLRARLDDRALVTPRIDDLVTGGLARLDQGRYVITRRGLAVIRPQMAFRSWLKMEKGG